MGKATAIDATECHGFTSNQLVASDLPWMIVYLLLIKRGFADEQCPIPWLGNRVLRFTFGENGTQNVTS